VNKKEKIAFIRGLFIGSIFNLIILAIIFKILGI